MAGSPNLLAGVVERLKHSVVSRVIGILALVVVAGLSFGVRYVVGAFQHRSEPVARVQAAPAAIQVAPHAAPATMPAAAGPSPEVAVAVPAKPAASPAVAAKAAPGPAPKNAHAANAKAAAPAAAGMPAPGARLASAEGNAASVVTAVAETAQPASPDPAHLDEHLTYQYNALGRRDPFQSLVDGGFVGADVGGDAPPDPGGMKVVGIVWGPTDQFAMVEDVRGNSFVLRRGDKLQNGYVEALKRDAVVVNITADGQSQSVVIPLVRKGESNAR